MTKQVGSAAARAIGAVAKTCGLPGPVADDLAGQIGRVFRHLDGSWVGFFDGVPKDTGLLRQVVVEAIKMQAEEEQAAKKPPKDDSDDDSDLPTSGPPGQEDDEDEGDDEDESDDEDEDEGEGEGESEDEDEADDEDEDEDEDEGSDELDDEDEDESDEDEVE